MKKNDLEEWAINHIALIIVAICWAFILLMPLWIPMIIMLLQGTPLR